MVHNILSSVLYPQIIEAVHTNIFFPLSMQMAGPTPTVTGTSLSEMAREQWQARNKNYISNWKFLVPNMLDTSLNYV
jgi:hypothetical protein